MINIYIIEDHPLFRRLLYEFIDKLPGMSVCGVVSSGQEALEQIPQVNPDLVLVDLRLPDMDGIEVVSQLPAARPALPAVILSAHTESLYVDRALAVGARGYLLKGDPLELESAIRHVMAGEIYLSPQLRERTN